MNKGQGSLEYLLILAAILAIAVVVVLVAQSMMQPAQEAGKISEDKYKCSMAGIELENYNTRYDGTRETAPEKLVRNGEEITITNDGTDSLPDSASLLESCEIGEKNFKLQMANKYKTAYLENKTNQWIRYGEEITEEAEEEPRTFSVSNVEWLSDQKDECKPNPCGTTNNAFNLHSGNPSNNITFDFGEEVVFEEMNVSLYRSNLASPSEINLEGVGSYTLTGGENILSIPPSSDLASKANESTGIKLNITYTSGPEAIICANCSSHPPTIIIWNNTN